MKQKLWIVVGLCVTLSMSVFFSNKVATAKEDDLLQSVVMNLENGYAEFYDIEETTITLYDSYELDGRIENLYLMEMDAVLKVGNVEEMDYYQGILDYCEEKESNIAKSAGNSYIMDELSVKKDSIYKDIDEYIGKEQNLVFFMKESYSVDDEENKTILFENGIEYVSWKEMLPGRPENLQQLGYSAMEKIESEIVTMAENAVSQDIKKTMEYTYTVSDAVNYMLRFTSNPTSCNICSTNCGKYVDTTKYSPYYKYYVSEGKHVDCANYISQALSDGGIPEDSTWKPESTAWVNVTALTNYMTSNGYWKSVNYNQVKKGDIVSFTEGSHVVMITAFDGVTYKYSGHTNDKKNATITINSGNAKKYNFYRVE